MIDASGRPAGQYIGGMRANEETEPAREPGTSPGARPNDAIRLSIVLPVYNEAGVLEASLDELLEHLDHLGFGARDGAADERRAEIVCVDDGSSDASLEMLKVRAANDPRLVVRALPHNRGKGAAVRDGMLAARGAFRVFMDVDLSTPLAHLKPFLDTLDSGHDVVIGNRRAPGANIERHQPWLRETLGKGFTLLTRSLLVSGVDDFTCGFKAFRSDAAEAIFSRSTLDGWAFDAELLVIADAQGLRLAQVPVSWQHEDDTKVRLLGAVLGSLRDLAVIAGRRLRGRYR